MSEGLRKQVEGLRDKWREAAQLLKSTPIASEMDPACREAIRQLDGRADDLDALLAEPVEAGAGQPKDSGRRVDEVKPSSCVGEHGSAKTLPELKYSCATCGRYMDKPCEHWAAWLANSQFKREEPPAGEPRLREALKWALANLREAPDPQYYITAREKWDEELKKANAALATREAGKG